jgi:hypothetical protein
VDEFPLLDIDTNRETIVQEKVFASRVNLMGFSFTCELDVFTLIATLAIAGTKVHFMISPSGH